MKNKIASLHRFHDKVGLYVGNGETVYLSSQQSDRLAKALRAMAKDINTKTFLQSTIASTHISLE